MTRLITLIVLAGLSLIGVDAIAADLLTENLADLALYCEAGDRRSCFVLETLRAALASAK